MSDLVQLGGLWESQDKNGNLVLSGYLGNAQLKIFKNTFKNADNQPDFRMYVSEKPKKDEPTSEESEEIPS